MKLYLPVCSGIARNTLRKSGIMDWEEGEAHSPGAVCEVQSMGKK